MISKKRKHFLHTGDDYYLDFHAKTLSVSCSWWWVVAYKTINTQSFNENSTTLLLKVSCWLSMIVAVEGLYNSLGKIGACFLNIVMSQWCYTPYRTDCSCLRFNTFWNNNNNLLLESLDLKKNWNAVYMYMLKETMLAWLFN